MASKRVLIVHSYGMEGSGSSTYTRGLAAGLLDSGYHVTVAAYRHRGDEGAVSRLHGRGGSLEALPLEALAVTYERSEFDGVPFVYELSLHDLRCRRDILARRLEQLVRLERPDVIIANHFLLSAAAAVAVGRAARVPVVVVSHGTDIEYAAARSQAVRSMARQTFRDAHVRVALADTASGRIAAVLGVDPRALTLVPPGICEGCRRPFAVANRRDRVAVVGRILLDKGPHVVLAAMADAIGRIPELSVVFIGDGPDREPIEELVAALDAGDEVYVRRLFNDLSATPSRRDIVAPVMEALCEDGGYRRKRLAGDLAWRVEFTGYVSTITVGEKLTASRLVVLPSLVPECFPLVLLEGMSMGCAIAATPLGGTADLLSDVMAEIPLLADVASIDLCDPVVSVARALVRGVNGWSPEVARDLSQFANSRYQWSAIGKQLVDAAENSTAGNVELLSPPLTESANSSTSAASPTRYSLVLPGAGM